VAVAKGNWFEKGRGGLFVCSIRIINVWAYMLAGMLIIQAMGFPVPYVLICGVWSSYMGVWFYWRANDERESLPYRIVCRLFLAACFVVGEMSGLQYTR
jgi:hypothetical protein